MKSILLTLMIALIGQLHLHSQESVDHNSTMSKGVQPGLYLELEGAKKKDAEKLWKKHLKPHSKKVKDKDKEYYTEEGKCAIINGSAALTIYAKFDEGSDQTTIYTWVDLGGSFLNEEDHPSQYDGMKQFLRDYYVLVRKYVVNNDLKDQQDLLKNLEKDLKKLTDKNKDYHKEIEKAQDKIRKAEEDIEKNLSAQDDKRVEIERQIKAVEAMRKKLNSVGKSI